MPQTTDAIPESPKPVEETVQKLFTISRYARYDKPQKIWLDANIDRQKIHLGWRPFYMTASEADEPDADKLYLLWKTIVNKIPIGYRNQFLTSYAGMLCCETKILPQLEILIETMLRYNNELKVPLSEKEVKKICWSIHNRSQNKRGGNPNVILKSKSKNKFTPHNTNMNIKQKKIEKWFQQNIKDNHKRELYFKTFLIVSTGEWNLNVGEESQQDYELAMKL